MRISYKIYSGSTRATVLSVLSGIFKAIALTFFIGSIGVFFIDSASSNMEFSDKIIFIVVTIVCFILGLFLSKKAEQLGTIDFEKKIKKDLKFAISMGKQNPENVELYMQLNSEYNEYMQSRGFNIQNFVETETQKIKTAKKRYAIFLAVLFIISIPVIIFVGSKEGTNPAGEEEKYQEYVKLNNDILWRFDASVTPYVEQFGNDDKIIIPKNEISGITPVVEGFFSDLDKVKEIATKKPKTDVDENAIALADETKKTYDIINEVCKYYNDKEYKNDNLSRAQELHDRYIDQVEVWYYKYMQFSEKLGPMAIKIMSKDLNTYKKNGQDFEYYTLKLLIDSEALKNYMKDNKIDDTNVLSSDLTQYKNLLNTLNETYDKYKVYSKDKKNSIHLEALQKDSDSFVRSANRILEVVDKQDLSAGIVHTPGIVYAESEPSPVDDLSYYLDRMISDYNSSIN